jgi:hypothetical protein
MNFLKPVLLGCLIVSFVLAYPLAPQAKKFGHQPKQDRIESTSPAEKQVSPSQPVKIVISTSRPEVTLGASYGVNADLQNVGSVPLAIYSNETILVNQPEISSAGACTLVSASFPEPPKPSDPRGFGP